MLSSSSEENDYDDDFDRDSEQENDGEGNETSPNNNKSSAGLQSPLGNNDKDESIVSSWDSSVKKPKRERSRVFDEADETSNEGNAVAAMNSYFKISDDEADESTDFGDKSAEFSFSKDSNRKKPALSPSAGDSNNGSRKDITNSKANANDAVEDEEEDDDDNDDDEDQGMSDEENEDDDEEDDDNDDNDFSDSDSDDEEEKHGWEKMDHEGKEYYWNWDTEETVWERPDGYRSPGAESNPSADDSADTEEDDQHANSKGPAALYLEHIKRKDRQGKKQRTVDDDESPDFETFMDDLEDGIAIRKFPSSGKWLGKSAAQERVLWLDRNRNVLYWQKGRKNKAKVKLESSIRLDDLISVSTGLKSEGLKRNGSRKNADLYMTLIGKGGGRDLDIEAKSEEDRNRLAVCFKQLLNAHR